MTCCESYYNLDCTLDKTCQEIILQVPNLPIGDYIIYYQYPFSDTEHQFPVTTINTDELILPNRFNNNIVYFKIWDVLNEVFIEQTINVNGIDYTTQCYKFYNKKIKYHSNGNIDKCLIPPTKIIISTQISDLYNIQLRWIEIDDIMIDLNNYCGEISSSGGQDLLDQLFTQLTTCTDLMNYLSINNISFTRTDSLTFDVLLDKDDFCCDTSQVKLYTPDFYLLFGWRSQSFCCNESFEYICLDGGEMRKGSAYFTLPLCDEGTWTSGPSCLPEEGATQILSNYCFDDYQQMADYINTQNLNANARPWVNGIIVELDFGIYNDQIFICGLELSICRDGFTQFTTPINCCPDPAPFGFFDINIALSAIFKPKGTI